LKKKPKPVKALINRALDPVRKFLNHKVLRTTIEFYVDPRIITTWCRQQGISYEQVYPKSLQNKFLWALEDLKNPYEYQVKKENEE